MNKEISFLVAQLKDAYEGDPWFGRNAKLLLNEVNEENVFQKPSGEHSILELVWHMVNWREFTISRINNKDNKTMEYFEANDWRVLDHTNKELWKEGLSRLYQTQEILLNLLENQKDALLETNVAGRNYTFKKLLHGILQHDIYHLGQIAYINKMYNKASL